MMRRRVVIPALLLASLAAAAPVASAQYGGVKLPTAEPSQRFSAEQIDNLTGPVALYPDALLAQVLVASTFPEQIEDAAEFVRTYGTDSVDEQSWDVSVKAVAHYPSALNVLADKIDWTAALGKAYAMQSSDVMTSVQRLRKLAADQGNLNSTPQQNVIRANDTYQIVPVEPRVIYVPVYDPYVIYSRPIFTTAFTSRWFSFGIGFPIGSWLIYDCDWGFRRVYYNGWSPSYYAYGGGWRQRSRPYIQVTNIYVNSRYTNVFVNRDVVTHNVNYYNVDRYASVHGGRHFEGRSDGRYDSRDNGRNRYAVKNDGDAQAGAVRGEGYRNGNDNGAGSQQSPERGNGNSGYGNSGRGNASGSNAGRGNRPPSTRDGSGYGNDRGGRGNGDAGTTAQPRAPEQRRNEPTIRTDNQPGIIIPERQAEPRTKSQNPTVYVPQRRSEPVTQGQSSPSQPRVAAPSRSAKPSTSAPQAQSSRQAPPQPRAEQSRGQKSAPAKPATETRSARKRGGN